MIGMIEGNGEVGLEMSSKLGLRVEVGVGVGGFGSMGDIGELLVIFGGCCILGLVIEVVRAILVQHSTSIQHLFWHPMYHTSRHCYNY